MHSARRMREKNEMKKHCKGTDNDGEQIVAIEGTLKATGLTLELFLEFNVPTV